MRNKRNLIGKKFGFLTVIDEAGKGNSSNDRHPYWFCVCICGNIKRVLDTNLIRYKSTSCGKCSKNISNL